MNRRGFSMMLLAAGASVAAGSGLCGGADRARRTHPVPVIAVFDGWIGDCRQFAAEARRLGAELHDTRGDVAALWHRTLRFRTHRRRTRFVGLVPYHQLETLRALVRHSSARILYEGRHDGGEFMTASRIVQGADGRDSALHPLPPDWPATMARALVFRGFTQRLVPYPAATAATDYEPEPGTLASWYVA